MYYVKVKQKINDINLLHAAALGKHHGLVVDYRTQEWGFQVRYLALQKTL